MKRWFAPLLTGTAVVLSMTLLTQAVWAQWMAGRVEQQGLAGQANGQMAPTENVLIILDASESMNDLMGGQPKIQIAKDVVLKTIRALPPNVNVGLRVYGHQLGSTGMVFSGPFGSYSTGGSMCRQTQLLVPMGTSNRTRMAAQLMNVQARGKTLISYALREAVTNDFVGLPGKKTIILVSDGRETCAANPCDLALDMVRAGVDIKMNTIGFGTHDRVADDQLKCLALSTKGKFYSANTAADLARGIGQSMSVQTSVQAKLTPGP